ncbi:hypothetical protein [Actinokineospora globicatena]|uniref:Uncharacterized protein n=1 Tax=Actinokineospora globicatena TaxID=103729 RepID=A0A9W6V7P3_9PSEU|nr:hypothetical protein [Actinokineospora globicatena]GLW91562.1 hypothetical protein Aglo03_23780 [Actinokineospora globicatena]
MRTRALATVLVATLVATGCGGSSAAAVNFAEVVLPGEAVTLTPFGDELLIGTRFPGEQPAPGLIRLDVNGGLTEVPLTTATPYGALAKWTAIDTDGKRIYAVGGERGGAHGNVRWSVWDGDSTGLVEKRQAFSTFGGYGAGDLIGVSSTPAVIGNWENPTGGFDVTTWTPEGDDWIRQPSAGTALEGGRAALPFPIASTRAGTGILVVGWQFADGIEQPVVWRSSTGITGWTKTPLPTDGPGAAMAVHCDGSTCTVAGRTNGNLALWRLTNDSWTQLPKPPAVAVSDKDTLAAPLTTDGATTQVITDGDRVKALRLTDGTWSTREVTGPHGKVTAATTAGTVTFLVADGTLWRAETSRLR